MKIVRIKADTATLLDPAAPAWGQVEAQNFPMVPTPLKHNPAIEAISPFLAQSTDHGAVHGLRVAGAHNGEVLALRLSWTSQKHDTIADLDQISLHTNAEQTVARLLREFDVVTGLSGWSDPNKLH